MMEDLEQSLESTADIVAIGLESTSGVPGRMDEGISWREGQKWIEASLTIPGLRGQPSAALQLELTETTATVTCFGQAIWSCVLKGLVLPDTAQVTVTESGMQPSINVRVAKADALADRWSGFVDSIGVDSLLQ